MTTEQDAPTPPPVDPALDGAVGVPAALPLIARFEVTGYDEEPLTGTTGEWIGAMTMIKNFTSGIVGSSVLHFVYSGEDPSRGYLAAERITGVLDDGRSGEFTVHHGGLQSPGADTAFGYIIPGTGTGDFVGFAGDAHIIHDDLGAYFSITLR